MAAQKIAAALGWTVTSQASTEIVQALADELAEEAASTGGTLSSRDSEQTSAFVVHGHDDGALTEVTTYLQHLGVRPIVLKDIEEAEESLLNRFFLVGGEARFAVVIVSPDDRGASRHQYDDPGVGERAMKFRARQNVILELGFFYGKLGFQNVFVLLQEPKEKWPDFELPSDLGGAVFKRIDAQGKWKKLLRKTLAGRGFELN